MIFLGSGLSIYLTKTTKQYPDSNNLGCILMKPHTELLKGSSNQSESNEDSDIIIQNQSKQTEIYPDNIPQSNSDIPYINKQLLSSQHRASSLPTGPTMDRYIEVNPP